MSHYDERRGLPRRRTRVSAAAVHGPDDASTACIIRDKSPTGARLLIQAGASVPDAFHLIELTTGALHRAQVVWRDQTFVGVTFHDSSDLSAPKTSDQIKFAAIRDRLTARPGGR